MKSTEGKYSYKYILFIHTLLPPYVSLIINLIFSISLKIVSSVVNNCVPIERLNLKFPKEIYLFEFFF